MERTERHPIWNKAFLALEFAFIPLALWWVPYKHLPSPGWAVAFIAVAAAAMSVHDEMRGWQKGIWLLIIGFFLITELRAISKDRAETRPVLLRIAMLKTSPLRVLEMYKTRILRPPPMD
jgi:hypothetical protein